ncbi:FtsX-like permease family protein, partial [Bacteroides sp. An19]|uniref:ABC transporter permease n=1 Tax=Bacteroides sp. An19 TaxID=1965580 RepID=UPI001123E71E
SIENNKISSFLRFTPIADTHFSKVDNKSASGRTTVYLLLCVSFLIVIIAAINFMNFTLAESPMRVKSINTQKVLGATVSSLRTGLVLESVLVSVIAFGVSLLLLLALRGSGLQDLVTASLDLTAHPLLLASTFGISVLMGVLAGLYPSYYVTSFPPALALKGSFGLSPKGRKLRTALVCFQFFVAFMLIIAIGIMYAQSRYIRTTDYGYDKDAIVVGNMSWNAIQQREAVVGELSRISGVEGVAFSQFVLSSNDSYMGWGRGSDDKHIQFDVLPVDYRYLKVMGIRVTEGRDFKPGDGDVYIFNEAARKKYPWMAVDQLATDGDYPIVGFCENIHYSTFRNDDNSQPMAFFIYGKDYADWGRWENYVNVRVSAGTDKVAVIHSLQKAMEKFTPGHDFNFRFMDQVLDNAYRNELRFTRQILLFSLLAIVISMIGVFGLTMFESEYRRKEIGIRKIFGSTTGEILRMFNKRYLYILIGCFVVAAPFGWWIGHHWLEGFAERTPIRAWIFLASFLLVTAITMITVTVQSWKNANENPANSIKTE